VFYKVAKESKMRDHMIGDCGKSFTGRSMTEQFELSKQLVKVSTDKMCSFEISDIRHT